VEQADFGYGDFSMITDHREHLYEIGSSDRAIYDRVLPKKSLLLDALEVLDWDKFEKLVFACYSKEVGQPAYPPLRMLKLELLSFMYGLSDRQLIDRASTDLLFRYFLQIGVFAPLPSASSLTRFRARLGADNFQKIFDELVSQARKLGLVKDRLRLTDASHVIASIAVPSTLELLAQLRDKMLSAIKSLSPTDAEGFQIKMKSIREQEDSSVVASRLQSRANLISSMLDWLNDHLETNPTSHRPDILSIRDLATKILSEYHDPSKKDRTLSVVDSDARTGFHHKFYSGYSMSVLVDADSGIVTTLAVVPANADEARNIVSMVNQEEEAHGNDIETLSVDGIGFHGPTLRELEDPNGLAINVITPVRDFSPTPGFDSSKFEKTEDGERIRCPQGHVSQKATQIKNKPQLEIFQFAPSHCRNCPLRAQCHPTMKDTSRKGRKVRFNDYTPEFERAREKTKTEAYTQVRKEHPMVERTLNELVNHHKARRTRYWGAAKAQLQGLLTGTVMNLKRMVRRVCAQALLQAA
jgi:transposase